MDVKGPSDSHDLGGNVSPRRREKLRQDLAGGGAKEGTGGPRFDHVTPELQRLKQQLREIPDVRGELVARATARMREEYFNTRESAERTAAAILRTLGKE